MSLGRVWKISELSLSGFPQELLVGWPSTDALQEEVLTALPTLGKIDFVCTDMEKKGLNMWNSMGQSGGHSRAQTPWREHLLQRVLISVLCPFVHPWATEEDLEGFYPSHKQFYLPAEVVFRDLQEEEDVACWQWHLSQHCVSRGRRSWDIPAVAAAQRAAPGKLAKAGLKICPFTHMGSACVCVCLCVCRPLWMTSRSSTTWELLS